MAVTFNEECLDDRLINEIIPLTERHNEEVESKRGNIKWNQYLAMYSAGIYRAYTVRDEHELIGYCGFVILPSQHHEGNMAMQDVIFLEKSQRKGMTGMKFLKYCIEQIEKLNVNAVNLTTTQKPDLSHIYERLGFTLLEKNYRKLL